MTHLSDARVRTTHVSGMATGSRHGNGHYPGWLRKGGNGQDGLKNRRKILLHGSTMLAFLARRHSWSRCLSPCRRIAVHSGLRLADRDRRRGSAKSFASVIPRRSGICGVARHGLADLRLIPLKVRASRPLLRPARLPRPETLSYASADHGSWQKRCSAFCPQRLPESSRALRLRRRR